MKKGIFKTLALFVLILPAYLTFFANKNQINSIPPKNVRDVLSNSQLSYYGGVGNGNVANDSILKLDLGTSFPSRTSNNLFVGDTIAIGLGGSQSIYTVKDIGDTKTIMLNTGLSAVAIPYGGSVISTRSAIHTVYFEPQVNAANGFWQFLIKATSTSGENHSDKIPDQNGFDAGALTVGAVTCPFGGGAATVGTTMAVTSGSPSVTSYYHVVQCPAGAGNTNPVGVGGSMIVGVGNSMLINPSRSKSSAEGNADVLTFIVRHLDSGSLLLDQAFGKIAVVESVRVTATVDPTLTFTIDNTGTTTIGSTACGAGTSLASGAISTTSDMVAFGSLTIGTTGNQLAQRLSCITNASGGYVVTAYEAGVMKNINTATTLPNTTCNGGGCTYTTAAAWTTASTTKSEFGYTMTNISSSIPFTPGHFKAFGIGPAQAQNIMVRPSLPSGTESAYVCYRVTVHTGQEAGDYEGKIVYTATATF
ncbi:MAG: hypothetical protein PHO75_03150 [Candidatus Shapirobacteria bacterium]|nr:hypothetical protein [Candidatus Shapirobacteria bacterium]